MSERTADTLLITLTGKDRPGVTSAVFATLARAEVHVVDLEQIVLRGRLVLGVLVVLAACALPLQASALRLVRSMPAAWAWWRRQPVAFLAVSAAAILLCAWHAVLAGLRPPLGDADLDEIGELSHTFDRYAARIRASVARPSIPGM